MTSNPASNPSKPANTPRRIIVTEFMTLDGVVEDPKWSFPYWNEETSAFKAEETDRDQALLLGRTTYEQFAAVWPSRKDRESGGLYFNPARKYVVSATRTEDIWGNATFLRGDLRKHLEQLRAEGGSDLVVHGSITLARWLLKEGLVDELRLLVYPISLGKGRRLFDDGLEAHFQLHSARATEKGVVALVYRRKEA